MSSTSRLKLILQPNYSTEVLKIMNHASAKGAPPSVEEGYLSPAEEIAIKEQLVNYSRQSGKRTFQVLAAREDFVGLERNFPEPASNEEVTSSEQKTLAWLSVIGIEIGTTIELGLLRNATLEAVLSNDICYLESFTADGIRAQHFIKLKELVEIWGKKSKISKV